ncbi:MAG: carboxypeptidase-like regulatory domain-containing protein [Acidobacteriota bacterium]
MRARNRITIFIAILFVAATGAHAQSGAQDQKATCSVTGTVTKSGKPARGVKVVAVRNSAYEPLAVDLTDADGHYHLKGIPPGPCEITLDAPASAIKNQNESLMLDEGENIEGIDLEIRPGGVITGRVTEANGRPMIDVTVGLPPSWKAKTDDRGMYRAYGLPPGRYKVSVARNPMDGSQVDFPKTYYPSVTNESKAETVEVATGAEVTNIDIKVKRPSKDITKTYAVTGRIVNAETGSPLPKVDLICQEKPNLEDNQDVDFAELFSCVAESDSKGEFRMDGLPPGKYKIEAYTKSDSPWYGKELAFEISNADIKGLEIRVHRAGSIGGVVVLEGANDPATIARLSPLRISASPADAFTETSNKDGSFRLTGVKPGSHSIRIHSVSTSEDLEIIGIERDGVRLDKVEEIVEGIEVRDREIEVGPGENVSGVRVVVAWYQGVVRGQIKIEGGTLPKGARLNLWAIPANKLKQDGSWPYNRTLAFLSQMRTGSMDARGRFVIERLPPGEYGIILDAYLTPLKNDVVIEPSLTLTRIISLTEGAEVEITLVLDLSKKPQEKQQ